MPQAYSLNLHQRVTRNTTGLAYTGDLTYHAQGWKRSSAAVGGYWKGTFRLSSDTLSKAELDDIYNTMLGCRLVETCYGMTSWEGLIWQMDYHQDGAVFQRTLDKAMFHNSVDVWYTNEDNGTDKTGASTNADSVLEYGTNELIISIGKAHVTAPGHMRLTQLNEYAWPRSRESGTHSFGGSPTSDDNFIAVTVAGYWHTLNWTYYTDSLSDNPNAIITAFLAASEFVTEGRVEDNSGFDLWICDGTRPVLLGDAIKDVISFGDSTGDVWQGGVYADRKFQYDEAPTDWTYQYRDGRLLDIAGQDVPFPLVEPGFLLFNASAPTGGQPPGTASAWDDPRYRHVSEVEFVAPDELRLKFSGMNVALVIQRRSMPV